jgi:hypothetical protein
MFADDLRLGLLFNSLWAQNENIPFLLKENVPEGIF